MQIFSYIFFSIILIKFSIAFDSIGNVLREVQVDNEIEKHSTNAILKEYLKECLQSHFSMDTSYVDEQFNLTTVEQVDKLRKDFNAIFDNILCCKNQYVLLNVLTAIRAVIFYAPSMQGISGECEAKDATCISPFPKPERRLQLLQEATNRIGYAVDALLNRRGLLNNLFYSRRPFGLW